MKLASTYKQINKTMRNSMVAALALFILCGDVLAESAGRILAVYGESQALRRDSQGNSQGWRKLNRGSLVYSGDIISTRRNSRIQVRFSDGTLISLKPNTQFSIDDYRHNKKTRTTRRSFFSLLTGGFRSITSFVTDRNKKRYRVKTKVATIGVRGTDYEASICNINCGGAPQGQLVLNVFEGQISIENEAGAFLMQHGDTGHVANAHTPVQITHESPAAKQQREQLIKQTSDGQSSDGKADDEITDGSESTDEAADGAEEDSTDNTTNTVNDAVDDGSIDEIIIAPETNDTPIVFEGGNALQCIKF